MLEALPDASDATRRLAGDLMVATITAVAKEFSETLRTSAEIDAYAEAMSDMVCAYLCKLDRI